MDFKEAYKFPLRRIGSTVWTNNNALAFCFGNVILSISPDVNSYYTSGEDQERIIDIINGGKTECAPLDLKYDQNDATITLNDKPYIIIRGWGHLTGSGGLNLPEDTATRLQDDFAEFIIKQLA